MIERYSRPKMTALWSEEAQYRTWLDIEILACEGWAKLGKIPESDLKTIQEKAAFDVETVKEIEKVTRHDMAAFVSNVQSYVGPAGRFIHMGMTSSDVLDTCLSYRLKKSGEILLESLEQCLESSKKKALQYKEVMSMGRTHGIHAEPVSFGGKWLYWYDQLNRSKQRLSVATQEVSFGKISGAVGNYANIPPEVEQHVCKKLGLEPDTFSTQVISRDRYAAYFSALGLLGSVVENIVTEIRHLQRTEVGEVREGFGKGQKGSSAMPHKRNPISSENLTGLARLLRGMVTPALENCTLWHERDISHSSVERVIGPDANILADYMLGRLNDLLNGLEVIEPQIEKNLNALSGVLFSQKVLLALLEKGMERDAAYEIVQAQALKSLDSKVPFKDLLHKDTQVTSKLSPKELDQIFSIENFKKHLNYQFKKVLG